MIQFFLDLVSLNTTHPTHPPLEVNVLLDILLDGIWDFIDLIENIQQRRRERQKTSSQKSVLYKTIPEMMRNDGEVP